MSELVRSLAWLGPVADLVKLCLFAGFVVLGLRAGRGRRQTNALLGFTVLLSTGVGLVQHEAWPFTAWALVHHAPSTGVRTWQIEAVDASGARWEVDPAVLHPLSPEDFGSWLFAGREELTARERRRIASFLLGRSEAGRLRYLAAEPVSRNAWLLGPLRAPYHFLPGHEWRGEEDVPRTPFVAIRIWQLAWDVLERFRGEAEVRRELILEGPGEVPGSG